MITILPTPLLFLLSLQLFDLLPTVHAGTWAAPAALSPQINGVCPNWASINCQSISQPNYCCTANYYCAYGGPENHIGCCPNNEICDGTPPLAYTTIYTTATYTTTYAIATYATSTYPKTTYNGATTVYVAGGGVGTTTVTAGVGTGVCSTLVVKSQAGLPTTAQGQCGTILVVSAAERSRVMVALLSLVGFVIGAVVVVF